ncbi:MULTISPECIES: hypothetical protein [Bacillus]|uniref:hypothetical protein n=1 Tax=Bacillus TaxID=1386 RepID=UPI000F9302F0|nr:MULTISPECIES: hypothetical protein [Bacillus]RUS05633.1 hypothetical protein EFW58_01672 [Bacillus velezensis]UHC65655.1 hypothetical protein K3G25_03290 [Bacillus sp. FCW2]
MNKTTQNLSKQIYMYAVKTEAFHTPEEQKHQVIKDAYLNMKGRIKKYKKRLDKFIWEYNSIIKSKNKLSKHDEQLLHDLQKKTFNHRKYNEIFLEYVICSIDKQKLVPNPDSRLYKYFEVCETAIDDCTKKLKECYPKNKKIRSLRPDALNMKNIINQFDSSLIRTLGIKENEITKDIISVEVFSYAVFKDIVTKGFKYNNQKYEYFTSSAGMIRNKKNIFIRSSVLKKNKNKIMCGLNEDVINNKGGMNVNKFNAYLALCLTASTVWQGFDINKCIVVDDFKTVLKGRNVDYIDKQYSIQRKRMDIAIEHMDGAGIMLPKVTENNKCFQFRLPFFKGLLVPFPFDDFIAEYVKEDSCLVKDIYGKEWDVVKDDVQIIFTKSQFKMWKYYDSWQHYKNTFISEGCEASKCDVEPDKFKDQPLNYQVLQTLGDMSDEDLTYFAQNTNDELSKIGESEETMLRFLRADDSNEKKDFYQSAIAIYPPLLSDEYSKQIIKDSKRSMVNNARAGKIKLKNSKRTYIAPDVFAFAQWLFLKQQEPAGLLKNGEVYCSLFAKQELDVLRSPHLYREHAIRKNTLGEEKAKWFISKSIYTSIHDLISKLLMFDVDGDDALIVSNNRFIDIAKKHMKGIVPLEYELSVAKSQELNKQNIYDGLVAAYSKQIGIVSNEISKVWNYVAQENATDEERAALDAEKLDVVKFLCMESNATIDYAKTLWMPERPHEAKNKISGYTKLNLPHFFVYAKGKAKDEVEPLNSSVVNRLRKIINPSRIYFRDIKKKLDYKNLLNVQKGSNSQEDIEAAQAIVNLYCELKDSKRKYLKDKRKNKEYRDKKKSEMNQFFYDHIKEKLLDKGNEHNKDIDFVVNTLVTYLYSTKDKAPYKLTLWRSFGHVLLRNLKRNVLNITSCLDCGCAIENPQRNQSRCQVCKKAHDTKMNRRRKNKSRNFKKCHG